ncbi:MAG: hypothetical protein INR73_18845 [Williamsia sp.]|nr:hypothetical protein [Williamsia sp.]
MKEILTVFVCLFTFILTLSAQSIDSKIKKTNSKLSNTDTAVQGTTAVINNASGTLGNAGHALSNLGNTIGSMVKRKPKPSAGKTASATDSAAQAKQVAAYTIMISITGADYASLKKLKESLKAVAGVQSVDMNYKPAGSSLSVTADKKADDLWDGLSDDIAAHYSIVSMNANTINIAYK